MNINKFNNAVMIVSAVVFLASWWVPTNTSDAVLTLHIVAAILAVMAFSGAFASYWMIRKNRSPLVGWLLGVFVPAAGILACWLLPKSSGEKKPLTTAVKVHYVIAIMGYVAIIIGLVLVVAGPGSDGTPFIALGIYIIFGALSSIVMMSKGRSPVLGWILGFILNVIGLIICALIPRKRKLEELKESDEDDDQVPAVASPQV